SDGVRRQDHEVENYVAQCRDLGIRYGLYHFLRPHSIAEQAQLFLSVWNALGGASMPPILDVEVDITQLRKKPLNRETWAFQIKTWLDMVETATGHKPMIYTSQRYWTYTFDRQGNPPAWTDQYPLWLAWYPDREFVDTNVEPPRTVRPLGWTHWEIWQYRGDSGVAEGFAVNDLDTISPAYAALLDEQFPPG
ncbi:MAG: GH25 family lysozyme, partial [Anaerolineae bacterium]